MQPPKACVWLSEAPGCVKKHSLQDVGRKRPSVTPFLILRNKNISGSVDTERKRGNRRFEDVERQRKKKMCECMCGLSSKRTNVNPVVDDILQTERLHCHCASGLCLLLGESSQKKKKGQKCFIFFHHHSSKAPQLCLFLDYSFVLASAQKKKVTFQ